MKIRKFRCMFYHYFIKFEDLLIYDEENGERVYKCKNCNKIVKIVKPQESII